MSTYREDTRVQIPASHELIYGPVGSGKTWTVREHLAAESDAKNTQTWIVDPHMAVPDFSFAAHKYANTGPEINDLLVSLVGETVIRAEQLASLDVAEFTPGDPKHGLPQIVVTVEAAEDVLVDERRRFLVERVIRVSAKTGIRFRLVVPKPHVGWFGGSELIRSTMTSGAVFACEKATA